jgi:acetyltransferase-like isoleucine patch superfamily enzyme
MDPGWEGNLDPVKIGDQCIIANHVTIYEGVEIGICTVIDDYVRIGHDSKVGHNARITHGAYLGDRVTIGDLSRIGGFICDGAIIGRSSSIMGNVIHDYTSPHLDWWDVDEASPVIEDHVVVGWGATVIGGVRLSSHTYVAAGATVTKDVPPKQVVVGLNQQIPLLEWKGNGLRGLIRSWTNGEA